MLVLLSGIACGGPLSEALEEANEGPAAFRWTCQDAPAPMAGLNCKIEAISGYANDCRDVVRTCNDGPHRFAQACTGSLKTGETRTIQLPHERFSPPVYVDSVCTTTGFENTVFRSATNRLLYGSDAIDQVAPGDKIDRTKWHCQNDFCILQTTWHGVPSRLEATVCRDGVTAINIQKTATFSGPTRANDTVALMRAVNLELTADGWTMGEITSSNTSTGEAVLVPWYKGPFELALAGLRGKELEKQYLSIANRFEGVCPP